MTERYLSIDIYLELRKNYCSPKVLRIISFHSPSATLSIHLEPFSVERYSQLRENYLSQKINQEDTLYSTLSKVKI